MRYAKHDCVHAIQKVCQALALVPGQPLQQQKWLASLQDPEERIVRLEIVCFARQRQTQTYRMMILKANVAPKGDQTIV